MNIRPYRPGDFEHILRRDRDDFGPESFENTKLMCENEITFTYEHEGIPVAIVGCQIIQHHVGVVCTTPNLGSSRSGSPNGTAQCWTIISDEARGKGIKLTKTVKSMIDDFARSHNIGRLQATVKPEIRENIRWIELLGFRFESTLFRAGPGGSDLAMYVRFYE